jgi:hypothetical protein
VKREQVTGKSGAPKEFSQLAELHVAGLFAEMGWRVYFPHRDDGFDFIAAKPISDGMLIRPVQVKGKYPKDDKLDKRVYGYTGRLTQIHPEMVLAIPYFAVGDIPLLRHVAFMPFCMIRSHTRGYRCLPAKFVRGVTYPRGDHSKYFDQEGLKLLESRAWCHESLVDELAEEDE